MIKKIYFSILFLLFLQVSLQAQIRLRLPIDPLFKGKQMRVTAYACTPDTTLAEGDLKIKTLQFGGKLKYDSKQYSRIHDIEGSKWKKITANFTIKPKSDSLLVMLFSSIDTFNIDGFSMEYKQKDTWVKYPLKNAGFEDSKPGVREKVWRVENTHRYFIDSVNRYEGEQSLRIKVTDIVKYGYYTQYADTAHVNGIDIYYETYGEGEPLLLLHGNNQAAWALRHQIDFFRDKYKVIAVDSRGQGHSTMDKSEMSYTLMAEDMNALLEEINEDSVHIVGWSDGGNTGLTMAMNYPDKVKSLTTMGANLYLKKGVIEKKFMRKVKLEVRIVGVVAFFNPKNWKDKYRVAKMLLKHPNIDPEDLKDIQIPVMVMAGENDLIMPDHTKLIAESIPNSKLVIIEGADHYAPSDVPDKFNQYVLDFLMKEEKEMK